MNITLKEAQAPISTERSPQLDGFSFGARYQEVFEDISCADHFDGLEVLRYIKTDIPHSTFILLNKLIEENPSLTVRFIIDPENRLPQKVNAAYNIETNTLTLKIEDLDQDISLLKLTSTIKHEGDHINRFRQMCSGQEDCFYGEVGSLNSPCLHQLNPSNFVAFDNFCRSFGMSNEQIHKVYNILNQELPSGDTLMERINQTYGQQASIDEQSAYLNSAIALKKLAMEVSDVDLRGSFLAESESCLSLSLLFAYRNCKLSIAGHGLKKLSKDDPSLATINIVGQKEILGVKINYLNFQIAGKISFHLPLVKFNNQSVSELKSEDLIQEGLRQFELLREGSSQFAFRAAHELS